MIKRKVDVAMVLVFVAMLFLACAVFFTACNSDTTPGGGQDTEQSGENPGENEGSVEYTVVFIADEVIVGTDTYTETDKTISEPVVPVKDGYTGEWEDYTLTTGDITVNALYMPIEYIVAFKADGKTVGSQVYTVEDKTIFEPEVPVKEGYTGTWEDYALITGNVTVNAIYTPIVYTITFSAEGETVGKVNYTVEDKEIEEPVVPTKEHYIGIWEDYTLKPGDITVNAVYTPIEYIVTFQADGRTVGSQVYTVEDKTIFEPEVPVKEGYAGTWEDYTLITGNVTVNAEYTPIEYTVTFKADGKTVGIVTYTVEDKMNFNEPAVPEKTGYKGKWEEYSLACKNIVVEALYTLLEYTVSYNANGGSNAPNAQIKTYNQDLKISTTIPERDGYIFVGWNNIYEDTVYQAGSMYSTDLNVTMYAMWESICENCNGEGVTKRILCSTCDGTGQIEYKVQTPCSICGGSGYCYACETCGSSNIYRVISQPSYWVCRSCGARSYDAEFKCPSCNNATIYKKTCTSCNGEGYQGVDGTCCECNGNGYIKDEAPTYQSISDRVVILTPVSGYEYSMDGITWQKSNIFDNLFANTKYTFYQRRATAGIIPFGTTSAPLELTTEDWTLYTINYNLDGGTKTDQLTYTFASSFTLTNPEKAGYRFIGWTGYNGNTPEIEVFIPYGTTGEIEFTAHWEIITYTITYIDEMNAENPNTQFSYTVESDAITFSPLSAIGSGYSFDCWLCNGRPVSKIEKGTTGDIILTASWIEYEATITCNEVVAVSEFDEIDADLFGAYASDTDGKRLDITVEIISGELKAGNNISVRFSTIDAYSNKLIKTLYDLKVYGCPTLNYDPGKDYINLNDELTPELFLAYGMDSFGNKLEAAISIVEDSYSAGDLITVKLYVVDLVGNKNEATLNNIKVYGEPEIFINNNLVTGDGIELSHIDVTAQDSFGETIEVQSLPIWDFDFYNKKYNGDKLLIGQQKSFNVGHGSSSVPSTFEVSFIALASEKYIVTVNSNTYSKSGAYYYEDIIPGNYTKYSWSEYYYMVWNVVDENGNIITTNGTAFDAKAGVEYTIRFSVRQSTQETKSYVHLYSEPRSTYPTYKATLSGNVKITSETKQVDISLGNINDFVGEKIKVQHAAIDKHGNVNIISVEYFVATNPIINCLEEYNVSYYDEITLSSLGISATDTAGQDISNIELIYISGERFAGSIMQFRVVATDSIGTIAEKYIKVYLFGNPIINIGVLGLKENSLLSVDELQVIAKDSFNNSLNVSVELIEGQLVKGERVKIKFSATDCVGNKEELIQEMLVYSNEINLMYSKPSRASKSNFEQAFNVHATDCFGEEIKTEFVVISGKIEGGATVSVKIVATDNAGNIKESDIISDVKIYDVPTITFARDELIIYANENLSYLFRAIDSFGSELEIKIEMVSGDFESGNTIVIKVTATDRVGNSAVETFELLVG